MIATARIGEFAQRRATDQILTQIPSRTLGDNTWVSVALEGCARYLAPAIASGKRRQIADAVRAIAHAPTAEQLDDVIGSACDSILSKAYASHDSQLVSNVAGARSVIGTVLADLRERTEREKASSAHLREAVTSCLKVVALQDERLAEHMDAVGSFAARIASAMQLPAEETLNVELAGRLHDIGSLKISHTSHGTDAFERHAIAGEVFVLGIPSLAHLAPIVRGHHERFDGRGYPDGLRGAEIPLASRIISIAASFVFLVTDSPEHPGMLPHEACHELSLAAGRKFDPDVVTATLHLLNYRHRTNRSA